MVGYPQAPHKTTDHRQQIQECPATRALVGKSLLTPRRFVYAIRCRRWSCAYCREQNKRVLFARVAAGRPQRLMTLTCLPRTGETPLDAYKRIRPCVTRLCQMVRDNFGPCEYVCVTERTEKGWPHFHVLMRSPFVPQHWLSDKWLSLTGAPVVDIRRVKEWKSAARYVCKYVLKAVATPGISRFGRVVSFTRGYRLEPFRRRGTPHCTWEILHCLPDDYVRSLGEGWSRSEENGGWTLLPATLEAWDRENADRKDRLNRWLLSRLHTVAGPPVAAPGRREVTHFFPGW